MKNFTEEAKNEVLRLLANEGKLPAIQYLRDRFNTSLEEANLLIQSLEKEQPELNGFPVILQAPLRASDTIQITEIQKAEIITKIKAGKKIEAVKMVKNDLKVPLKQALQMVDSIHREFEPNFLPIQLGDGCAAKIVRGVAFLFLAIAILCLSIAAIVYFIQEDTVTKGEKVSGKVVGFSYSSDGGAAPTIEYELNDTRRTYQSQVFSTPPSFALNETVILYINKEKSDDIVVDSFSERWLGIVVFAAAAGFFLILMIIFLFVSRKL